MAHTYDTKVNGARGNANPKTLDFTPGAGASLLILTITVGGTTSRTGGAPTFNGHALTQIGSELVGTETIVEMWYLLNPGTVDDGVISVPNTGTAKYLTLEVCSFISATGFSALRTSGTAGPTDSTNPTGPTHTGLASGDVIVAVVGSAHDTWAPSAQTGTSLYTVDNGTYGNAAQYLIKTDAVDQAMAWTFGNSASWEIISAVFQEETSDKCWVGSSGLQVAAGEEAQIAAAGLQLAYGGIPDYGIGMAGLQVVYQDEPETITVYPGVQEIEIASLEATAYLDYKRKFPVPPRQRVLQSQSGRRRFPVVQ